ncbi:kinase-like domain-containing protein [Gloeopeniophorella convolvens]|nr:kinase-like domain-containing protein [Gloeopeniophorella convolvens]
MDILSSSDDNYDYEPLSGYVQGGYHPVHLGDTFHNGRYTVIHKLGWGIRATVWLAKDARDEKKPRFVALKFFVADAEDGQNELDILQKFNQSAQENPLGHFLVPADNFKVDGPNGAHLVLVYDLVGPGPDELRSGAEGTDSFVWTHARNIGARVTRAVAALNEAGFVHADLGANSIAFALPELADVDESAIMDHLGMPAKRAVEKDADNVSLPRYVVASTSFKKYMLVRIERDAAQLPWQLKLTNLGKVFAVDAPSRAMRAPPELRPPEEVFNALSSGAVEQDWGHKANVWPLGCWLYELVAETSLFIPAYEGDMGGLCVQYVSRIGPLPDRWRQFWSDSKKEIKYRPFEQYIQSDWLDEYRGTTGDDLKDFCDLLRQALVSDPEQRATAKQLLEHAWFKL